MLDLVEIRDLHVRFRADDETIYAVNGVNIVVEPGQSVSIVGESGSGKSVTVTAIARLLPRTAEITGTIRFDGKDMRTAGPRDLQAIRGHHIGMVFQNPHAFLNPTRTIGSQLIEPLLFHHLAGVKKARALGMEMLERVGIADAEKRIDNYPFEFSGGMLQRVLIAMALIAKPKLIIADEPTTALDVTVQAQILRLLKEMQRELGMSMIFVTHDLAVAAQVSDVIYVMYGGLVVERLASQGLMRQNGHPYLTGLLASLPRIDQPVGRLPYIPGLPVNTRRAVSGCPFYNRCQWRMDQCRTVVPHLKIVEPEHEMACWRADEPHVINGKPS